ncbi:MAG: UvrD-helicase domain-containing protein [Clostridia bacterium]|nr:UvrD-helicase domain-containing protein [Clostridia bacterium]
MSENLEMRYIAAKRALFDKAYSSLNEKQREAVFTTERPLLILAGAGSGKTTVLVKRIAFIIKYGNAYYSENVPRGLSEDQLRSLEAASELSIEEIEQLLPVFIESPCPPWQVLAITFTNKAANEIKARLASAFSADTTIASDIWAGTFHSICMRILRKYGDRIGFTQGFTIYDTDDAKKLISSCMKRLNIDEKVLPIKTVMNEISRAKDKLITPEMFLAEVGSDYRLKKISDIYTEYQKQLSGANALDFDDIIMQTVRILEEDREVCSYYQNRFKYVCVDEYQDTNRAQFVLTSLLSGGSRNLMVVGDDDQSIYKFRGATIENILDFDRTYSDAKVIKLEQNYRSTQNILDAANEVIKNNKGRKGKNLWTAKGEGEKIQLSRLDDQNLEARYIIDTVNRMVSRGDKSYKDFAVLYRVNAQSNNIERAFAKSGMPYRVLGGIRFSDRKEIKDIVAYLQLINNHSDRERLLRIINEPKRKIGPKAIECIIDIAEAERCSLFEVIKNADRYIALANYKTKLSEFAALIEDLTELSGKVSIDVLTKEVLERSGYRQMLVDAGEEEAERLENLEEFISNVIEYQQNNEEPTLTGFLEETALVADVDRYDETADAVVLMTIHSAKGLEFPIVFLPGLEDGIFPGMQSIFDPSELEEERRLAYVALTRAKERLFITHAKCRLLYGRTQYNPRSRFVDEIPQTLIDDATEQGIVANQFASVSQFYGTSPKIKPSVLREEVTINKQIFKKPSSNLPILSEGDRVSHMTFGEGEIISVKPMGADTLYEIIFDKVGTKRLMATYAKLKKL